MFFFSTYCSLKKIRKQKIRKEKKKEGKQRRRGIEMRKKNSMDSRIRRCVLGGWKYEETQKKLHRFKKSNCRFQLSFFFFFSLKSWIILEKIVIHTNIVSNSEIFQNRTAFAPGRSLIFLVAQPIFFSRCHTPQSQIW